MKFVGVKHLTALTLASALLAGCATIFAGTTQDIMINTNPAAAKATVMIDGIPATTATTPTKVRIEKKGTATIEVIADGYMPARLQLEKGTSGWYWANLITMDFIGMIIDLVDGAAYEYDDQIMITLTKMPPGTAGLDHSGTTYAAVDFTDAETGTRKRALIPMREVTPRTP